MHRAFEVEAKSELRGEFYAVPHEERSCPAVAQSRIGPAGVIVNCRLVPNEIGARMDPAVGAAGQRNPSRSSVGPSSGQLFLCTQNKSIANTIETNVFQSTNPVQQLQLSPVKFHEQHENLCPLQHVEEFV
jgi:hypothetical protein